MMELAQCFCGGITGLALSVGIAAMFFREFKAGLVCLGLSAAQSTKQYLEEHPEEATDFGPNAALYLLGTDLVTLRKMQLDRSLSQ